MKKFGVLWMKFTDDPTWIIGEITPLIHGRWEACALVPAEYCVDIGEKVQLDMGTDTQYIGSILSIRRYEMASNSGLKEATVVGCI